jgi:hypothetical protein
MSASRRRWRRCMGSPAPTAVNKYGRDYFGRYAGYAQEYIYYSFQRIKTGLRCRGVLMSGQTQSGAFRPVWIS